MSEDDNSGKTNYGWCQYFTGGVVLIDWCPWEANKFWYKRKYWENPKQWCSVYLDAWNMRPWLLLNKTFLKTACRKKLLRYTMMFPHIGSIVSSMLVLKNWFPKLHVPSLRECTVCASIHLTFNLHCWAWRSWENWFKFYSMLLLAMSNNFICLRNQKSCFLTALN